MATETAQQILTRHEAALRDLRVARPVQSGQVTITPSAANTPTSASVVFDRPFKAPPRVVATAASAVPGTVVTGVGVTAVTNTGCTVTVTRTDTTATPVTWMAHG